MGQKLNYDRAKAEKEVNELLDVVFDFFTGFGEFDHASAVKIMKEVDYLIGTAIDEYAQSHDEVITMLGKVLDGNAASELQMETDISDSDNSFFENTCLNVTRMTTRIKQANSDWLTGPVVRMTLLLKYLEIPNPVTGSRWHLWHSHASIGEKGTEGSETYNEEALKKQNQLLEEELERRKVDLRKSLEDLKAAQRQLVQQEKLASLGQLTAGIAHEIKNPLNFVNNFSELSRELVEEIRELSPSKQVLELLDNIESNIEKIHDHGTRADGIVKSMLQHSREGSGEMEPANLNELVREYVNLSFHGMRAGKNPINVDIELDLDDSIDSIPLVSEDFSRVIVNLCNNAFDAMRSLAEKRAEAGEPYTPKLSVRTRNDHDGTTLEIKDNGPGIPGDVKEKILQPFFTTKKGTEGTGLGLSITNDIVEAHGGTMEIETVPGQYTIFRISLNTQ